MGLTDSDVAHGLGLSQPRYARYVSDEREPNFELLVRICDLLGMTPNDLLLDVEVEKPRDVEIARAVVALKSMDDPLRHVVVEMIGAAQKAKAKPKKALS